VTGADPPVAAESQVGHVGVAGTSIRHLHSGIHGSVLGERREVCAPTIILTQSEQNSFHTQAQFHFTYLTKKTPKNSRAKPSQVDFYKKPAHSSVTKDNHALSVGNSQRSPAWQNIDSSATGLGGCREEEGRF